MFVEVNDEVKVEDLLRGVIIQSGNDATIVLSEGLSETEKNFAYESTQKAKELGMNDSNFVNASGWPDEGHYSTARDLATLSRALIKNFPQYYKYYGEKEFTYNDITQPNRNPILFSSQYGDGIKTGHTEIAGYGLMGSGERDGRRVIFVLNGLESEKARAEEGLKILQHGLFDYEVKELYAAGSIIDTLPVRMGKKDTVSLTVDEPLSIIVPKGAEIKMSVQSLIPVVAPVEQGQKLANALVSVTGQKQMVVPLYASEPVKELGFFAKNFIYLKAMIGDMLGGNAK